MFSISYNIIFYPPCYYIVTTVKKVSVRDGLKKRILLFFPRSSIPGNNNYSSIISILKITLSATVRENFLLLV